MAQQNKNQNQGHSRSGSMTAEEAGHLGGVAPHECRGFQCQKEHGSKSSSSSSRNREENE
ncbi:MAG TPA: hypothetical protein VHA52_01865 [Candidatus Babeliaceae bacterium]|nr:hypothetical protein [Candidatus Babeliaceae bacterium]